MSKKLHNILKSLVIICAVISVAGGKLLCAIPSVTYDPKEEPKPLANEWKYDDDVSKAIRAYDKKHQQWRSTNQAILYCQRKALIGYQAKMKALLDKTKYNIFDDAKKLKDLDDSKDQAFSACMNAFQTNSAPEKEVVRESPSPDTPEWKNNDDVSVGIRKYDNAHNKWVDENQATLKCQQKAQSNYQSQKIAILDSDQFDPQTDAQDLEDLKTTKANTFEACAKAFER